MDLSATLELLASLTQYAEAGAVQPHTLAQAAQHALDEHGDHVEILVAVAKLHLATGYRDAASRVLGKAARLFPGDSRVEQLASEAGLDMTRRAPLSARNEEDGRSADERPYDTSVRRRSELREDGAPDSARTPVSLRHGELSGRRSWFEGGSSTPGDTPAPTTSRSVRDPQARPTVKMARVSASPPERRWGKGDGREPLESRPALDSIPDVEPLSEGPRSARLGSGPRGVLRDAAPTPASPMPRVARAGDSRKGRAATGNLKLLDPGDERRHLDRYELIGEIASGGMASVFLARIAGVGGFQRFYAIKRLHPHLADEQEFIDMFLDEARLAAGIHHPNVVPILEVGTSEAGYYLVMDYIEGDTLAGVTARASAGGHLPKPIAMRVLLDALQGLHAAHELTDADGNAIDLVHRDCSPQNILVGVDGSSRITDFGVARATARLSTTRSATVKGKLAYLSPEQATGQALDRRSDLFSMAVILWEALAGRRLFRAESEGATLSRILVDPIPHLSDHAPDIPGELGDVVARMLSRNPSDRYSTAADMTDVLERTIRAVGTPELFIASPRDVAGYMRETFGSDIHARREAVRAWTAACGELSDGPRSRRGSSPTPPSVHGPKLRADRESDAPADSEVPSTQKEASLARDEKEPTGPTRRAPVVKIEAPPPVPVEEAPPAPADEAPVVEPAAPSSPPSAADEPSTALAAPAPAPAAKRKRKSKHPPPTLIVATVLLVLAAVVTFVLRTLG